MGMKSENNCVHVFERAGLGKAPFRFIGVTEERGPKVISTANGVTTTVGAPGQPMGSCAYCGTGIAECCHIRSADGKEFMVGNVCVGKTHDRGLISETKRAIDKARKEARHKREAARIAAAREALEDEAVREVLAKTGNPNPNSPSADALSWAEWMMAHAGNAGRMKVARLVEKIRKEQES